ncbi:MAG: nucleotide exchange factor GrpE [Patescibacteria group bacterium]|nr:nucleotide exchange factor GrpE [Patescibacteria group bacterium]
MDEDNKKTEDQPTEIEKLQKQCDEYLNGWKRAKADYINLKKESDAKMSALLDYATASFVVQMIPIYDNLKKALNVMSNYQLSISNKSSITNDQVQIPKEFEQWVEGVKQIKKQFEEFLKSNEIIEMKTVGEKFNPEFHEAILKEKKEGVESGMIISEASSGYLMKDKTLIPAKVIVSE